MGGQQIPGRQVAEAVGAAIERQVDQYSILFILTWRTSLQDLVESFLLLALPSNGPWEEVLVGAAERNDTC